MYQLYKGYEDDVSVVKYANIVAGYKSGAADADWESFRSGVESHVGSTAMARDTIMAEKHQLLVVAFFTDNPGVWALHCHNDFHAVTGMFRQIIERPKDLRSYLGKWTATGTDTNNVQVSFGTATAPQSGNWGSVLVKQAYERNVKACLGVKG